MVWLHKLLTVLFFAGIAGLGGVLFYKSVPAISEHFKLKGKTPADCAVVDSYLNQQGGASMPVIEFSYQVGEKIYFSRNYSTIITDDSNKSANAILKHPPGSKITCLINPADPLDIIARDGSIDGLNHKIIAGLIGAIMFLAAGAVLIFKLLAFKRTKKGKKAKKAP